MDEEPLPIATYARALAHLVCHRDKPIEKVLGPLGITVDQLRQADAYFNERLAESHRLRKGVLAMTFASAFAEARRAQGLFSGDPAPTPVIAPGPSAEAPQALPSYMAAPGHGLGPSAPMPSAPMPSAPVPSAPVPSAPISMAAPVLSPMVPVPPLAPSAAPIPPSPVHPAPAIVAPPAAVSPGAALPPVHAAPASLQHTVMPATAEGSKASAVAMPFRPAATQSSASSSAPASVAAPPTRPAGPGTGTALAPSDAPRLPDTPWDQAKSRVGKLTLAHYAALTVELSRNPADMTPLYQRYGLSGPDDLRHVQAAFQVQLQFDANLRTQYEALVGRMRSMSTKRDA